MNWCDNISAHWLTEFLRKATIWVAFSAACILPSWSFAQQTDGVANYAYSIFLGTGRYRVNDRTTYVLRAPLAFSLRQPGPTPREVGYTLLLPIAAGITNFKDFDSLPEIDIDSLETISVAPGLEIQIPISARWLLKPFAQVGLGWDFKSSSNSFIWGVGTRTRATFGKDASWVLGGELLWSGNDPKFADEPNTRFSRLRVGGEYRWRTGWSPQGRGVSVHSRIIQNYFTRDVAFEPPINRIEIGQSTELGITLAIDKAIRILGYDMQELGFAYERAGSIKAIKLVTTFPF